MYDSRQDELAFRRVASISAHDPAAQDDVARALGTAAQQGPAAAADVAELTAASQRYESDLSLLGLSDDDLARGLTPADYKRRIGRSALTAALTAPLAAIGAVIHFVPYQIMKQVGKRPSEGMRATVKLLGCTALFTAVYSAIGIRAGRQRGLLAGLAGFLLGPLSGYVTVRWAERMDRLGGLAQARAVMAERGDLLGDLAARRADVVARTEAITGQASANKQVIIRLGNSQCEIELPTGDSRIAVSNGFDSVLSPPDSGGLLPALYLWRKLLVGGPSRFGQIKYEGAAPLRGYPGLYDVLNGVSDSVETRFYLDPADGFLACVEMFPDDQSDPCEVYFGDYQEVDGRMLPHRMEVRYGDNVFGVFTLSNFDLQKTEATAQQ
jgi:hypothetical protein